MTKTLGDLMRLISEARRLGVLTDDELRVIVSRNPRVAEMLEIREQLLNGFVDGILDCTIDPEVCRKAMGDEPEFVDDVLDRIARRKN